MYSFIFKLLVQHWRNIKIDLASNFSKTTDKILIVLFQ